MVTSDPLRRFDQHVGGAQHGQLSPAIFPCDGRPQEWEILTRLAALCAGMTLDEIDVGAIDDGFFAALCAAKGIDAASVLPLYEERGPERLLDLHIRTGAFGDRYGERPDGLTLESFRDNPHGIDMGPLVPRLDEILATASGKVELAPSHIIADVPRLAARLDREPEALVLVSRRHLRSNNSWLHNVESLVRGRERCTLLIHPGDAARCGVTDGGRARVTSEAGSIEVAVEVSDEMLPGVVSLPHGWGHDVPRHAPVRGARPRRREQQHPRPGRLVDPVSNNAVVNGIPVTIAPS